MATVAETSAPRPKRPQGRRHSAVADVPDALAISTPAQHDRVITSDDQRPAAGRLRGRECPEPVGRTPRRSRATSVDARTNDDEKDEGSTTRRRPPIASGGEALGHRAARSRSGASLRAECRRITAAAMTDLEQRRAARNGMKPMRKRAAATLPLRIASCASRRRGESPPCRARSASSDRKNARRSGRSGPPRRGGRDRPAVAAGRARGVRDARASPPAKHRQADACRATR